MNTIEIHWDFTDPLVEYVSYKEGLALQEQGKGFFTHCTAFFNTDNINCIVRNKADEIISVATLLKSPNPYTVKDIRPEHNIEKILLAGGLEFTSWENPKLKDLFGSITKDLISELNRFKEYVENKENDLMTLVVCLNKIKVLTFYYIFLQDGKVISGRDIVTLNTPIDKEFSLEEYDETMVNIELSRKLNITYQITKVIDRLEDPDSFFITTKKLFNKALQVMLNLCKIKYNEQLTQINPGTFFAVSNKHLREYETNTRRDLKRVNWTLGMAAIPKVYGKSKHESLTFRSFDHRFKLC